MDRVAITGMGVVSSLGDSHRDVHAALCQGRSGIRPVTQFASTGAPSRLAGPVADFDEKKYLPSRNLRPLDRLARLATSAVKLALVDTGWTPELLRASEAGLALGTMFGAAHTVGEFDRGTVINGPGSASPLDFANTVLNAAAGQAAIWHGLTGINSTITTGITAGLDAIGYATDLIRSGRAAVIVAGGAEEFSLEAVHAFERSGLLCGCHGDDPLPVPFHARRNGIAPGEGAAFVVLEDLDRALAGGRPVLAEIRGHASTMDTSGGKDGKLAVEAMARSIQRALRDAGCGPDEIDCLSASANGSVATDGYEACAAASALGGRAARLPVTAVKSMLGDTLGASGPMQLIDLVETMRQGTLPGIPNLDEVDAGFPLPMARPESRELNARIGLVNSVGAHGSCSSLVVALRT